MKNDDGDCDDACAVLLNKSDVYMQTHMPSKILKITNTDTISNLLHRLQSMDCVQVGYGFVTQYPVFFWSKIVGDNFETVFGLQDLSKSGDYRKFRILSERMLRVKYEFYSNRLSDSRRQSCRYLQTVYPHYDKFDKCNFQNADDCLRRCLSKSIWAVHVILLNTAKDSLQGGGNDDADNDNGAE